MVSQLGPLWLASACLIALIGCQPNESSQQPVDDGFDRAAMLSWVGAEVIRPRVEAFHQSTVTLRQLTSKRCQELSDGASPSPLEAKAAWRASMRHMQGLELMRIGPLAHNDGELRDLLYSWPIVSPCAVEQALMAHREAPSPLTSALPNRRGLDALETLLFRAEDESACPPQATPKGWSELSPTARSQARACYAAAVAQDLESNATTLHHAWREDGDNYAAVLASAGGPQSPWKSQREALNGVSDALFYLDTEVKSMKLGQPAGLVANSCNVVDTPCPEELESPWASHSGANIRENVAGFKALLLGVGAKGVEGTSFDDWLVTIGAEALAAKLRQDVLALEEAVAKLPDSLTKTLSDPEQRQELVTAWSLAKELSATLKSQFLTTLSLDLPDAAATDND